MLPRFFEVQFRTTTKSPNDAFLGTYPRLQKVNLLEPEFYIWILAQPVGKMRIIQEPNTVALWNKRHFEEKKTEIMQQV